MSGKFGSITAGLLVRKGAVPSPAAGARGLPTHPSWHARNGTKKPDAAPDGTSGTSERKFVYAPDEGDKGNGGGPPGKPRRIVLTLSAQDYQALGLVAVKTGMTRRQLAQSALDAYFDWLVAEYGETCSCIVVGALRCDEER